MLFTPLSDGEGQAVKRRGGGAFLYGAGVVPSFTARGWGFKKNRI